MLIGGRMNYVQLHLGDWIAGTLDLTPTERGVYMDLLVRYYKEERPLMQDECKRIARGYAPAEQEAMQYVLQRFFTLENGEYRQSRCDEEIEKAQAVSNKRKRAAASRWAKKPEIDASAYPNAEQTQCECNANGMLTINQQPITKEDISLVEKAPAGPFPSEETTSDPLSICPAKEIVELFNNILGQHLGAVRKVTPARQQAMRARWHDMIKDSGAKTREEGLDWCRQYFEAVAKRPFLLGQKADSKWHADFDWLMQSRNYVKIFEGAYRG